MNTTTVITAYSEILYGSAPLTGTTAITAASATAITAASATVRLLQTMVWPTCITASRQCGPPLGVRWCGVGVVMVGGAVGCSGGSNLELIVWSSSGGGDGWEGRVGGGIV